MRRWLLAAGIVLAAGCRFDAPGYGGTQYACASDPSCPVGFVCVAGVCEPQGTPGRPDAGARLVDARGPDVIDAAPPVDAPAPDANLVLLTIHFGERPTDEFTGVTRDTYLESTNADTNFGGDNLIRSDADPVRVGLLRFVLDAAPPGMKVVAAQLHLFTGPNSSDLLEDGSSIQVVRVLEPWSSGGAKFNERITGTAWKDPGAGAPDSRAATPIAAFDPNLIATEWTIALPPDLVTGWLSGAIENDGVALVSTSATRGAAFVSSNDAARPEQAPELVLILTPSP